MATAQVVKSIPTSIPLIDPDQRALFIENYNKRPFLFRHNLCEIEQFQPWYLRQIAQRFVDADTPIYCSPGKGKVDAGFDAPDEGGKHFTPAEALKQMADEELLFKMPKISRLPEYQPFIERSFNEILEMSNLPTKGYDEWRSISIFMAGPRRITPYHIDAEISYLCQITGTKTVWIADGTDREIVTEEELERFWRGEGQSAKFKEVAEQRAWKFTLAPGMGVQIPINFPHWVENGDEVSMSASLGFHLVKYRPGAVHRFNSYLRQFHLKPTPPGKVAWLDAAKENIYEFAKSASRKKRVPVEA
jgi:hypothetical protein